MKHSLVIVALLVLAALGLTAASTELAGNQLEVEDGAYAYQWAELADDLSSVDESFVESSSEFENDYSAELKELKAALNIASLIQGSEHDDGEHDAAMLETEMTSALSPEATASDFFRFARTHSRLYANEKATAAAVAAFKNNKKAAAELNAELGITSEQNAVFAATGPLASMNPKTFKSRILSSKNPRGRSRAKKVRLNSHPFGKGKGNGKAKNNNGKSKPVKTNSKPSANKSTKPNAAAGPQKPTTNGAAGAKANNKPQRSRKVKQGGNSSLQPAQQLGGGHAAGLAGGGAGQSGKTGGQSGKTGGQSGTTAGQSGKTGGQSGKTGGKSGKSGGKSGKTGGGGVVYSSIANGTSIALPGQGNNKVNTNSAAPTSLDPATLKRFSGTNGIGSDTYDAAYNTLKTQILLPRALQYNDRGDLVTVEPIQVNDCGSCWAIAAQQSLQRYWTGAAFKGILSVQQLLDCARTADSKGCRGGTPMDALEYWARNLGAVNRDYVTLMVDGTCKAPPFANSPVAYPSAGWDMLIPECEGNDKDCLGQVKLELMVLGFTREKNFQPPIAYVDASQWQNYHGGIFPPTKCSSTMEAGNHVVQIVGSGVDAAGIPYWILVNPAVSVPFGVNACGLFNFVIYTKPPPFAAAGNAQQVPSFNAAPVAYTAKPVELQKVETFKGVLSKTSDMFAQKLQAGPIVPTAVPGVATQITQPGASTSPFAQPVVMPRVVPTSNFPTGSTGMAGAK